MIKNIRVLVTDIDGTLAVKGGDLMPKTREAFNRLHKEGVLIGVASGRPLDQRTLDKAKEWNLDFEFDFAIGMNGGDLWTKQTNKIEHFYQLKNTSVKEICELIWDLDLNIIIYENAYSFIKAKRMDDFLRDSQKRNHSYVEIGDADFIAQHDTGKIETHSKPAAAQMLMERVNNHPSDQWNCIKTFSSEDHETIEFIDPRVQKGVALEKYAQMMNIPLDEIIAFGDQENDIGLLKSAGWGVCMINGSDDTKAVAQAITEYSVFEDGVGRYLEDHWFNHE